MSAPAAWPAAKIVWAPSPGPASSRNDRPDRPLPAAERRAWVLEICALCDARRPDPGPRGGPPVWPAELEEARWAALRGLGWGLRTDGVVSVGAAAAFFRRAGPGLAAWMGAKADALARVPALAGKSRRTLLSFVALGAAWVQAVTEDPGLAEFLEGEGQPPDLEAILADVPPAGR